MLVKFLKQSWLVMVAALGFGLLVAAVNGSLEKRIEKNAKDKLNREMGILFKEHKNCLFEEVAVKDKRGKNVIYSIKDEPGKAVTYHVIYTVENTESKTDKQLTSKAIVGYAIEAIGGGFADKIRLLVAVDVDLKTLLGYAVLKSNETPGFGDKIDNEEFKNQFIGCPAAKLKVEIQGDRSVLDETIVAITGATVSSEAVTKIVNKALKKIKEIDRSRKSKVMEAVPD